MRNAKNVITLATKCKAKLSRENGGGEVDELSKMLEGMGIVGGVTKGSYPTQNHTNPPKHNKLTNFQNQTPQETTTPPSSLVK